MTKSAKSYRFRAALFDGPRPIMPRPGFVFRRTPMKIFFIGFNKTATSALSLLMMASGVLCIHSSGNGKLFGRPDDEQALIPHATEHILSNLDNGRPPLAGLEGYDAFMDLTVGPIDLCMRFKELFSAYPDAVFVLNTRPVDDWIASRIAHRMSVTQAARHFGLTHDQVINKWRSDYTAHHAEARAFFSEHAPQRFLEWEIRTPPEPLARFLAGHGVQINPNYYFKVRETGGLFFPEPLRAYQTDFEAPILVAGAR